jgi:Peptidase M50B-like
MNARWLLLAILLTVLLFILPFAQVVTYPFLIFSTFIHETAHAVTAVLTGGRVDSLIVRLNGSGVTYTRGGIQFLISSAGYIGTILFGGILLIVSRRREHVRGALYACASLVSIVTALFAGHTNNVLVLALLGATATFIAISRTEITKEAGSRRLYVPALGFISLGILIVYLILTGSLFSWASGLIIASSLLAIARFATLNFAHFFVTFLAVQCSLNALDAIKTVYFLSLRSTCGNDAASMAAMTGVPAWIWALLWGFLSLMILAISAAVYARGNFRSLAIPA